MSKIYMINLVRDDEFAGTISIHSSFKGACNFVAEYQGILGKPWRQASWDDHEFSSGFERIHIVEWEVKGE